MRNFHLSEGYNLNEIKTILIIGAENDVYEGIKITKSLGLGLIFTDGNPLITR